MIYKYFKDMEKVAFVWRVVLIPIILIYLFGMKICFLMWQHTC